jgi:hypothetical protein
MIDPLRPGNQGTERDPGSECPWNPQDGVKNNIAEEENCGVPDLVRTELSAESTGGQMSDSCQNCLRVLESQRRRHHKH